MFVRENEENKPSVTRFQSMLKTNDIFFFDSVEFEEIISHYLSMGIFPLAKKAVKMGLSQHPKSTDLKLLKIEVLIMEDKLKDAAILLNEIHMVEPYNEDIFLQKATLLSKQGYHREAIAILKDILSTSFEKGDILSRIAMEYLEMEDYQQACDFFMKAVDTDDETEDMLFYVIYCFSLLGQKERSIEYLTSFLDRRPYAEEAWYYLGKEYFERKEYDKALIALDYAIISDGSFVGAYLEKGKVLESLNKYQEALETYLLSIELDDPTEFAYLRIGRCHEKLGRDSLAIKYYLKAHEHDPLGDRAIIAISDFYERKGNYLRALQYMTKAINMDHLNIRFWKRYGRLNQALNFLEEAERGYQMAIENGNYELDIWIKRGDLLISFGKFESALTNFEHAAEFHQEKAELEYRLAGLYYSLNDTDKGDYHLDKALELNPRKAKILKQNFPRIFSQKSILEKITKYGISNHQGRYII